MTQPLRTPTRGMLAAPIRHVDTSVEGTRHILHERIPPPVEATPHLNCLAIWRRVPSLSLLAAGLLVGATGDAVEATHPTRPVSVTVIKYATHPALDELEHSFETSLRKHFLPTSLSISRRNADANRSRAKQLAEQATANKVDLIVALGTPAAQAVHATPSSVPMLFGAVSDPLGAGLLPSDRTTGITNVNRAIVRQALQTLRSVFPRVRTIGTIWNPAEQNSRFVQGLIADVARELAFHLSAREVTSVNQLKSTVEDLLRSVDAIYSANDNLVNLGAGSVSAACRERGKPFMIGELSAMVNGATLAVGVDYTETGVALAEMARRILLTGSVAASPPSPPPAAAIWIDEIELTRIGGSLPVPLDRVAKRYHTGM